MKNSILKSRIFHQLTGAAVAVAAIALFSFSNPDPGKDKPPVGDEPGGGMSIEKAAGQQLMANMSKWKTGGQQKGGFLSKLALDDIFDTHPDANGIYWYVGTDSTGTSLKLIIEAGHSRYSQINKATPSGIYISETTCPVECGSLAN
jgi:hypothetical protein